LMTVLIMGHLRMVMVMSVIFLIQSKGVTNG
jgi:hypothetical protein